MEVIRVIKNKNYTTISNQLFKNKKISLKAKGLMGFLLSLPSDWDLSINGIVACSKEGKSVISSTIKELINTGYIERIIVREKGKFKGYDYFVFENPPKAEKPNTEKPNTEKPNTENQPQLSKEVIKERINKNTLNKEKKFKNKVFSFDYPKAMLNDFYNYWSEPNRSGKKMRYELQPTFDIKRRLITWAKREKGFRNKTMSKIDMHLQSQKEAEELLKKYHDKGN